MLCGISQRSRPCCSSSSFITTDKPAGFLRVMELSARVFGVSYWSLLVPQALAGVAVFTLASAACAVAPSLGVLVAARAVQAAGAALIVPTSLGLLYPAFAKRQHAMVVGIWAGVAAVAGTAGPPVGGLLVEASWRWIFLISVPIGVATLLAGLRVLPEVRAAAGTGCLTGCRPRASWRR
jgi:MFS family permease